MCGNIDVFIYYFVDSFCIGKRYVMVTYYVILFASLFINYLLHHHFCLCGIYVTTYVIFGVFFRLCGSRLYHLRLKMFL
jgi:hypothetical protein